MASLADRVAETTTTTGSGAITLAGAVNSGYVTFATGFVSGSTPYYAIVAVDTNGNPTGQWEVGQDTNFGGSATLNRSVVLSNSSGTTAALNLSAGTKQVLNVSPAAFLAISRNVPLHASLGGI